MAYLNRITVPIYKNSINGNFKTKPFLKWAGGKSQLLKQFEEYYPNELKLGLINNYYEPFLGGGAVFFDIVQKYNIENFFLFDINEELILVYKVVQNDVLKLINRLDNIKSKYYELNENEKSEYYYEQRDNYNQKRNNIKHNIYSEDWILRAAQMIFLNKTCFNGLFRLNQKGEFNVPFGRYKNPQIYNKNNLLAISGILQKAVIKVADFKELEGLINENSFVYFDPPYRPISKTSSFTTYSKIEFNEDQQKRLAQTFKILHDKGCKLMLSNSDPKNIDSKDNFFEDHYSEFNIHRISASRMINCLGDKRGKINELIITNY